jgi:flagellar motor switch protein FliN
MVDDALAAEDTAKAAVGSEVNGMDADKLKVLENIEVDMSIEVGRTEISIRDLLRLNEGSVVELDRLAGEPLDILIREDQQREHVIKRKHILRQRKE